MVSFFLFKKIIFKTTQTIELSHLHILCSKSLREKLNYTYDRNQILQRERNTYVCISVEYEGRLYESGFAKTTCSVVVATTGKAHSHYGRSRDQCL